MSAATIPQLLTVDEFGKLPDPPEGRYELHHGEAVFVTFPKPSHKLLQRRLRKMLEVLCEPVGYTVDVEYPYRPLPEHELLGADVACFASGRDQIQEWLKGSPELVVEVKSRSNTKAGLHDKAMTTLAGQGAVEFWIVDANQRTVTVYSKSSGMHVYREGQTVPIPMGDGSMDLVRLFEGLE